MNGSESTITLAITGASGSRYALRLLESLLAAGCRVHMVVSDAARIVIPTETGLELPDETARCEALFRHLYGVDDDRLRLFALNDWFSPIASGSSAPRRMVVCPCSTGTLGAIASGASNNLIERAADVVLKERNQLVLVVRETPLSSLHLENMLKLSNLGVTILPASPGFYHRPERVEELIDFIVGRVLDQLEVASGLSPRWGSGDFPAER